MSPLHALFRLRHLYSSHSVSTAELCWAQRFHHRPKCPPTHPLNPINPDNARILRITAAAGTELADTYSYCTFNCLSSTSPLSQYKSSLQPIRPPSCTRYGWFRLPPIDQYSSLLPPVGVCTVLSCNVGDLPLRTPKDRRHGKPLPHHLANPTHAHLIPIEIFLYQEMPPDNITQYYAPFPVSILLYKPGCIRVTHPSAGRHQLKQASIMLPLDLHVLCLPLAFILSQDQTLHCIIPYNRA